MKWSEIPSYTQTANYNVDVSLEYLMVDVARYVNYGCNLNPDFQRPIVWSSEQQSRYVEHVLKGGKSGTEIMFNCPNWMGTKELHDFVLVDGKQRLEAFRRFFANEIQAFGQYFKEFEGRMNMSTSLRFYVNNLKTRREVLQWYLDFNAGGTVHSEAEIARVKALLDSDKKAQKP